MRRVGPFAFILNSPALAETGPERLVFLARYGWTGCDKCSYEPALVRFVASVFEKEGGAHRGVSLDGWQLELFVADLDPAAWSAADGVAAYFGRGALENRFSQEDREHQLDRILSYHLPGQELASLVAFSVWNLRLAQGFALETLPATKPTQAPRRAAPCG